MSRSFSLTFVWLQPPRVLQEALRQAETAAASQSHRRDVEHQELSQQLQTLAHERQLLTIAIREHDARVAVDAAVTRSQQESLARQQSEAAASERALVEQRLEVQRLSEQLKEQSQQVQQRAAAMQEEERRLKGKAALLAKAEHDMASNEKVRLWAVCALSHCAPIEFRWHNVHCSDLFSHVRL